MTSHVGNLMAIAVAQPLVVPGDVAENVARMTPMVQRAAAEGAVLVLFSECAITGYDLRGVGLNAAVHRDDSIVTPLRDAATKLNIAVVAGFHERDGSDRYVSTASYMPDGRIVVQRKHNVTQMEVDRGVRPGPKKRDVFQVSDLNCVILICADSGIDRVYDQIVEQGADTVLVPTAGLGSATHGFLTQELDDPQRREKFLLASQSVIGPSDTPKRLLEHGLAMACCNQAGYDAQTGFFHPGHSMVIDRTGLLTALIPGCFLMDQLLPRMSVGHIHPL